MLKNILRLLLSRFYSKNESALVARQSLPDTSEYVDWSSSAVVGKQGTYICPDDGYVVIAAKSGSNTGVNVWGSLDIGVAGASGIQPKVFCPCRKGRVINYIITGELHLTRFYKFIGGGYQTLKRLLQGGGLCLSHWFSSLRRSSLQVRRNGLLGFLIATGLGIRKSISQLCRHLRKILCTRYTFRRRMELLRLPEAVRITIWTFSLRRYSVLKLVALIRLLFRLEKERRYSFITLTLTGYASFHSCPKQLGGAL